MQIQLKFLAEEMQAISKGLEKVIQELTAAERDGPVSENFCKVKSSHLLVCIIKCISCYEFISFCIYLDM